MNLKHLENQEQAKPKMHRWKEIIKVQPEINKMESYGDSQDTQLLTNRLRKYSIYTQRNFTQPQRRMKCCHLQVNRWNWRTSSEVKLVRLRRPKATFSPSYVNYSCKTNAVILWDMGHTKGRSSTRGIRQGKEAKNLNMVDVFTVQE
jgi:hypothetical protein